MFIGEGPGQVEDEEGRPFVGPAGQLLRQGVTEHKLEGEVYFANIVKCRPPGNREPLDDEIAACRKFLAWQVSMIDPQLIVTLGNPATRTVLGRNPGGITKVHGLKFTTPGGRIVMPMIHPAAPLHNPDLLEQYSTGWNSMIRLLLEINECPY